MISTHPGEDRDTDSEGEGEGDKQFPIPIQDEPLNESATAQSNDKEKMANVEEMEQE